MALKGSKNDGLDPLKKLENLPESMGLWAEAQETRAIKSALANGALDKLSEAQRQAFELVVLRGETEETAALVMRCRRSTVRTHIKRGGERLRKIIEAELSPMPDEVEPDIHRVKPAVTGDLYDDANGQ